MRLAGAAREAWRDSAAVRLGASFVAMVVVAEGAVWLLSPGEQGIAPVPVDATELFAPEQLERARDYRGGQRWLAIGGLAAQALAVGALAAGRPRAARRALAALPKRPLAGGALAGVAVVAVADVASLPFGLAAYERAVDAGISTQSLGAWLADAGRGLVLSAALVGAGAALLVALVRRYPRRWWVPGAAAAVAIGAVLTLAGPVLIAPAFNDFEPLPAGSELRADVVELGERGGVQVDEVLRVDASRRSSTLNAYVAGLGPTKRVVLYDNLIADADRDELRSVVAHELAHVAHADIPRGIAFAALVAPLGLLFARELAGLLARGSAARVGDPASVPALLLAIAVTAFVLNVPGNQLSREVEASADAFALRTTDDPRALVALQRRLVERNLSDPDPPAIASFVFATHPSTVERIGSALAYRQRGR